MSRSVGIVYVDIIQEKINYVLVILDFYDLLGMVVLEKNAVKVP